MLIRSTPLSVNKNQIDRIALAKGGPLGKLLVRSPYMGSKLEYVPSYIVHFDYEGKKLSSLFRPKSRGETITGSLALIADASSMRIGVLEQNLSLAEIEISQEDLVRTDDATVRENKIMERSMALARKVTTLRHRISPKISEGEFEVFYRPRWVSEYGREGKVTHRLVTAADHFKFIR
ncbi:hypothetical protein LJC40_03405 [Synergistaceae bacterium OttesenSCG-928-D05]|nr:hypothetical protein [Synergistaceae bacterium OttesenSCG-928-D05]